MSDLGWAVKNGDLEKVKEFIENKVNSLGIKITIGNIIICLEIVIRFISCCIFVGGCVYFLAFKSLND